MLRTCSLNDSRHSRGHSILCSRSLLHQQDMKRWVTDAKIKWIYILYFIDLLDSVICESHYILWKSTVCKLSQNHKIPLPLNPFVRLTLSCHFHWRYNWFPFDRSWVMLWVWILETEFWKNNIHLTFIIPWAVNLFAVIFRSTFLCFLVSRLMNLYLPVDHPPHEAHAMGYSRKNPHPHDGRHAGKSHGRGG